MNKQTEHYDLQVIMRQGDLNIQRAAAAKPDMTASEYFDMLAKTIYQAPVFLGDLRKLLNLESDRPTFQRLSEMLTLLTDIGFEKDMIIFDSLIDAYEKGYTRLVARYAKKIKDDFEGLFSRVIEARIPGTTRIYQLNPDEVSLGEFIGLINEQQVTDKPVIFAIDDSPAILKALSSSLSSDYKVYMLVSSAMLEKSLGQVTPDLFLLDYKMPDINGFELVPIIRRFSRHKDTPIIFLTSEGSDTHLSTAYRLGACDYLVKPVHPDTLREKIAQHIPRKTETRTA